MALTKVTGQVIKNTTDVTVGVLTVTNNLSVGGTVSIGGTLTYEDVTNVDAVGLITARNGIVVGSGITLSKDGDIFATGVTTSTTFVGALTGNVTGNISGGTVAGSTGTFTGDVDIADKIVHTGDTDTLIRFPSADNIQFDVAGVERLRIDNSDGVIAKHTTAANLRVQNSTAASSQTATLDMAPANGLSGVQLKCTSEEDFSTGANRTAFFTIENRKDGTFYERLRIHSGGQVQIAGDSIASISSFADDLIIGESGSSAISGLTLCSTDSSGIRFHDTGDAGEIEFNHDDDSLTVSMAGLLKVRTNSAERLRIDSSGRVLVGTTSVGRAGADELTIGNGSGDIGLSIRSGSSQEGNIYFSDSTSSGNGESRGIIRFDHSTDSLQFFTASGNNFSQERLRIPSTGGIELKTDGKGIQFPTPQTPTNANTARTGISSEMRYYETGTVTPNLSSTVLNGLQIASFTDASFARRVNRYVRVGHIVHCFIEIKMASSVTFNGGSGSTSPVCIVGTCPFKWAYSNRYDVSGEPDFIPCSISYDSSGLTNDSVYAVLRRDYNAQPRIDITRVGTGGSRQSNSVNYSMVFPANASIAVSYSYPIDLDNADY